MKKSLSRREDSSRRADLESSSSSSEEEPNPFDDKGVRRKFVHKVFLWVGVMLIAPFFLTFLPYMHDDIMEAITTYYLVFTILGVVGYVLSALTIFCCDSLRNRFPCNLILLFLLSTSIGLLTMMITSKFKVMVPVIALGITFLIVVSIAVLARWGPCDVTGCGIVLCIISLLMCFYALIMTILSLIYPIPILHTIFTFISICLFTLYLWYDLQLILGGRRYELSPDDHVLGAAAIFIDIAMIFYNLIQGVGSFFGGD